MNHQVVRFVNNNRTYQIAFDVIEKYPNSILYGYWTANNKIVDESVTLNIDYDAFGIVYDVMCGTLNQWDVPPNILEWMDMYGFVNDILYKFQYDLNKKRNEKLIMISDFMNGKINFLSATTRENYTEMKKIFKNSKNIMPVQIIESFDEIVGINILNGIPIFSTDCINHKKYTFYDLSVEDNININDIRKKMLLHVLIKSDKHNLEKMDIDVSSNFFSDDEIVYIEEAIEIFQMKGRDVTYNIADSKIQTINLYDKIIPQFFNNTEKSINKIISFIKKEKYNIARRYNQYEKCRNNLPGFKYLADDYYHSHFRTFFGFINLTSLIVD